MREQCMDERAATVLATAMVKGDQAAAEMHGVSDRSVRRWRAECENDETLAAAVHEKKAALERDWADELGGAISKSIAFLSQAAEQCNPADHEHVRAVAGALKILTDVAAGRALLDARLNSQARQARAAAGQVAAKRAA